MPPVDISFAKQKPNLKNGTEDELELMASKGENEDLV